jgi:hypothetical protein
MMPAYVPTGPPSAAVLAKDWRDGSGNLVKLEVGPAGLTVRPATLLEEWDAWVRAHVPGGWLTVGAGLGVLAFKLLR